MTWEDPNKASINLMDLGSAVLDGNYDILKLLLSYPEYRCEIDPSEALHVVGFKNYLPLVKMLLEYGADAEAHGKGNCQWEGAAFH